MLAKILDIWNINSAFEKKGLCCSYCPNCQSLNLGCIVGLEKSLVICCATWSESSAMQRRVCRSKSIRRMRLSDKIACFTSELMWEEKRYGESMTRSVLSSLIPSMWSGHLDRVSATTICVPGWCINWIGNSERYNTHLACWGVSFCKVW